MFAAYATVTGLGVVAHGYAAYLDFVRHRWVIEIADRLSVPRSMMFSLGCLLALGALGLLAGFAVPLLGLAAAAGLVLYFLIALGSHLRVRDRKLGLVLTYLALAGAALALNLAHHGL